MRKARWRRLMAAMEADVELVRFIIVPAAWLVFLGSPLYWLLWYTEFPAQSDSALLRVTSSLLCVPALFYARWPPRLLRWFPFYWHFAILYIAPFTFTFLLLENEFSNLWLLSHLGVLLLLMEVIPNVFLNAIVTLVGGLLGVLVWWVLHGVPAWQALPLYYPPILGFAMGFSIIALYATRQKVLSEAQRRSESVKILSGTIAHEVRKPLTQAQQAFAMVADASRSLRKHLSDDANPEAAVLLARIDRTVAAAQRAMTRGDTLVGIILRDIREERIDPAGFIRVSIVDIVKQAIGSYAFGRGQRERIRLELAADFDVLGDEALLVHVIFNLLQNALIYDQVQADLRVTITVIPGPTTNALIVEDNGPGIPLEQQRELLLGGGSERQVVGGLGLPFCRRAVSAMGGTVTVTSALGEGTKFTLHFRSV